MNYVTDNRVRAKNRWYEDLDETRMVASTRYHNDDGDEIVQEVPIRFDVCPTCNGKGKHVNPSIDSGGISQDQFDEDPDFAEGYHSGDYDVTCYGCDGKRVVAICLDEAVKKALDQVAATIAAHDAYVAAERAMGA